MPVFRWGNAFEAFRDLEREMDRLLQSAVVEAARVGRQFPLLNVYERDEEYLLVAQVPGVNADNLDLSVADGRLTLRGERSRPQDVSESQYRRSERPIGRWERTISLPDRVDENNISADFRAGLLLLRLPKRPESPVRKIAVGESRDG